MAIAGRVAIVPKGDWSADATYKRLDAVTYNNTLYFAKKEVPAGTSTSNTEYWSKSIVGGAGAIATTEDAGIVKPDGTTITVDEDGTLHGQSKVDEMTGATADKDGTSGTVPAPKAGQENHVLKGNGAWEALAYDSELSAESENAPQTKVVDAKTKKIEENLSQLSNPNLLINPDFRINQRGGKIVESGKNYYSDESCGTLVSTTTSAYTATKISNGNYSISIDSTTYYVKASDVVDGYCENGYTVDRWRIDDESVRLIKKNKGIHLSYSQSGQIRQILEEELEGTFTLSVKFSDNNGSSGFEIQLFNSDGWTQFPNGYITTAETSGILKTTFTGKVLGVVLRASSANIEWVKLELGSVATPFVPPDPATELLKCQRYFQKLSLFRSFTVDLNENGAYGTYRIPVLMRTAPTIIQISLGGIIGTNNSSAISEVLLTGYHENDITLWFHTNTTMSGNSSRVGYLYDTVILLESEIY